MKRTTDPQDRPLITIGITCYNAEDTIERAIAGALGQSWENREIIVVDDSSTDGSLARIQRLADRAPEVRVFSTSRNSGYPTALNLLVEKARGDYIAFFDDDDDSDPRRIATQWARIRAYAEAHGSEQVLCYTNRAVVRAGETRPDHVSIALGAMAPEPHGKIVADYILGVAAPNDYYWGMGMFGSCTLMAPTRLLSEIGGFDPAFRRCAEWDMAIRAALGGAHFISVNEPLVTQYKTVSSDKSVEINFDYRLKLRQKHRDYLDAMKAYDASVAAVQAAKSRTQGRWMSWLNWQLRFALSLPPSLLIGKMHSSLRANVAMTRRSVG